jgi:vacuolar-type H+-ATPase subunit I/STV1
MDYLISLVLGFGLIGLSIAFYVFAQSVRSEEDEWMKNRLLGFAIFAMLLGSLFFYSKNRVAPVLYQVQITAGPDGPVVGTVTLRENPEGD